MLEYIKYCIYYFKTSYSIKKNLRVYGPYYDRDEVNMINRRLKELKSIILPWDFFSQKREQANFVAAARYKKRTTHYKTFSTTPIIIHTNLNTH